MRDEWHIAVSYQLVPGKYRVARVYNRIAAGVRASHIDKPWLAYYLICVCHFTHQYSSGKSRVVALLSASVMIHSLSPSTSYEEKMRKPSRIDNSFSCLSSRPRSPQSPLTWRLINSAGARPDCSSISSAPGVATT